LKIGYKVKGVKVKGDKVKGNGGNGGGCVIFSENQNRPLLGVRVQGFGYVEGMRDEV
jgi:hypothetical protein